MKNITVAIVCVLSSTAYFFEECVGHEERSWQYSWREGGYDASTSLYVFLRHIGVKVDYGNLAETKALSENASFADVFRIAKSYGADVALQKCTMKELRSLPFPQLIHIDTDRDSDHGEFMVLIASDGDGWLGVRGSQGTLSQVTKNTMIRQWSGIVMVAQQKSPVWWVILVAAVTGLASGKFSRKLFNRYVSTKVFASS